MRFALVTLHNSVYAIGGNWQYRNYRYHVTETVQMFDGVKWVSRSPKPLQTIRHAVVAIDQDRALICGGYLFKNGTTSISKLYATSECFIYSATNDSWTHAPSMAYACASPDMVFVDGTFKIIKTISYGLGKVYIIAGDFSGGRIQLYTLNTGAVVLPTKITYGVLYGILVPKNCCLQNSSEMSFIYSNIFV
jgi:hypothetical protein